MKIINDENLTITRVAPLIRKRLLSPVELTKALLARIERLQPALNAFITVTPDLALRVDRFGPARFRRCQPGPPCRQECRPDRHGRRVPGSIAEEPPEPAEGSPDKVKVTPEKCFVGLDAYQKVIDSGVDVVLLATPPGFGRCTSKRRLTPASTFL